MSVIPKGAFKASSCRALGRSRGHRTTWLTRCDRSAPCGAAPPPLPRLPLHSGGRSVGRRTQGSPTGLQVGAASKGRSLAVGRSEGRQECISAELTSHPP